MVLALIDREVCQVRIPESFSVGGEDRTLPVADIGEEALACAR